MMYGQKVVGKKAQTLVSKGALLIDVRSPVAFRDGTLPGAVNMSLRQLSQLINKPKNTPIVVFGEGDDDPTLKSALNYISQYGFSKVYSLGSKENWDR